MLCCCLVLQVLELRSVSCTSKYVAHTNSRPRRTAKRAISGPCINCHKRLKISEKNSSWRMQQQNGGSAAAAKRFTQIRLLRHYHSLISLSPITFASGAIKGRPAAVLVEAASGGSTVEAPLCRSGVVPRNHTPVPPQP